MHAPDAKVSGSERRAYTGEEWIGLIDDLLARGVRYFTLVGGEPLLSPNIDSVIEHLYQHNVFVNLTTNGALLPRRLDLARKVSNLTVSLDGDADSNDQLRGKGWHARALTAIEAAVAAGIPVRLNVVVTRANADQIGYIISLCDRYRMVVTFTPCIDAPDFRQVETRRWQMNDVAMRAFFTELLEWKSRSPRIMNSEASIRYMIEYPTTFDRIVMEGDPEQNYYPLPCPYGRIQYHFNEYGMVYPCANWWNKAGEFTSKSVFIDGLDAAIAHATAMPCRYCSFCNIVDWNEMTRPRAVVKGLALTVLQSLGARR